MEGTPPEMEANAQEAPDFKEVEAEAFLMREGEGRRRTRCHLSASSPVCLKWTLWDILGQFGRLFDEFGAFSRGGGKVKNFLNYF